VKLLLLIIILYANILHSNNFNFDRGIKIDSFYTYKILHTFSIDEKSSINLLKKNFDRNNYLINWEKESFSFGYSKYGYLTMSKNWEIRVDGMNGSEYIDKIFLSNSNWFEGNIMPLKIKTIFLKI
jgi:hypothetical protein